VRLPPSEQPLTAASMASSSLHPFPLARRCQTLYLEPPFLKRTAVVSLCSKPVFVHVNSGRDVLAALEANADVIAHTTPQTGPWNDQVVASIRTHDAALIPTLWIWKWYARHDPVFSQNAVINAEVSQLRTWLNAGKRVLFGTDLGAVDPDPREEYDLMMQAGMTARQILAALTTAPAAQFKHGDIGSVVAGKQADLVVLRSDPVRDIRVLTQVQYTIVAGRVVYKNVQ